MGAAQSDTRLQWFGSVPKDWKIARNKNAFRVVSKTVGDRFDDFKLLSLTLQGVKLRDIESGKGKFPASFETYQEVWPGDIVFCLFDVDETPRTVGLSPYQGMITGAYTVVRCLALADPRYVTYFYLSIDQRKGLRPFYTGLRKVVRTDTFLNATFPLPDLDTQKAIADFLDRETARIDQLIEKKQLLVRLLGEKARRAVSSTFERLALEYQSWRLKHVLASALAYGANEPADGDDPNDVRYIRITDIDADGSLRGDTFKSLPRERVRDYLLKDGDILFARSGGTVGKAFIYSKEMGECCYAGYLIRARVNNKRVSPNFLYQFTSTDQYWNHILGTNIQATIQNVSAEKYANLEIPLPPRDRQDAITTEIAHRNAKISSAKSNVKMSIDRLQEFRSAMITAAVTGQIDVTTWGKSGQTDRRLDEIQEAMRA